jgi:hypothetical protein
MTLYCLFDRGAKAGDQKLQSKAVLRLRRAFDRAIFGTVRRQANSIPEPGRATSAPGFLLNIHGRSPRVRS